MERLPPQSIEAEEAVLGGLLIDPYAVERVKHILSAGDFYRDKHGWIYAAILHLHNQNEPVDFLTVCDTLDGEGKLDATGGGAFISELINAVPTSIHVEHYARIVVNAANKRRLIQAATEVAKIGYDEELDDLATYSKAQAILRGAEPTGKPILAVGGDGLTDAMFEALAQAEMDKQAARDGYEVKWPWKAMLAYSKRWRAGQPVVVIAEGGAGKTAFCMCIASHNAMNGGKIVYAHTEDEPRVLLMRQLSSMTGVPFNEIESATYADTELVDGNTRGIHFKVPAVVLRGISSIRQAWRGELWLLPCTGKTVPETVYALERLQADIGLPDAVIFDWFFDHRMREGYENMTVKLTMDLKDLKDYAAVHKVRLLVAMQTGKIGASKGRLTAYDAFWTSSAAHYGKLVMGLKREREMVGGEPIGPFKPEIEVFISKANLDVTGSFKLQMRGETFSIFEPETKVLPETPWYD
ncbi:MAG: hypothetical protein KKA68_21135 [Gammaproteobacteria bacterium]|nr:hypothetical protein [Gammaproteobacteria bacterium]